MTKIEINVTCGFCSHETTVNITTVSLAKNAPVSCPTCGGKLGTVDSLARAVREQRDQVPRLPPVKNGPTAGHV